MTKASKGLGDSVEKELKATGIDKVAKKVLGDDCGCEERKQKLNKMDKLERVLLCSAIVLCLAGAMCLFTIAINC